MSHDDDLIFKRIDLKKNYLLKLYFNKLIKKKKKKKEKKKK